MQRREGRFLQCKYFFGRAHPRETSCTVPPLLHPGGMFHSDMDPILGHGGRLRMEASNRISGIAKPDISSTVIPLEGREYRGAC